MMMVVVVIIVGGGGRWIRRVDFVNINVFHVNIIKHHIWIRIIVDGVVIVVVGSRNRIRTWAWTSSLGCTR